MHMITILRDYLGMNQQELARLAGVSQCDISEMETRTPYGYIGKYKRLSETLKVPVHVLVNNEYHNITEAFFDTYEHVPYQPERRFQNDVIGRGGEELALALEQERVGEKWAALAKLVLPYYKLPVASPGYDILSYNEEGKPVYIEVKTTEAGASIEFALTKKEFSTARKLTENGETYLIYRFSNWGTDEQKLDIYNFKRLMDSNRVSAHHYYCHPAERRDELTGIGYYRRKRGLTQKYMAQELGIRPYQMSLYETGDRECSVTLYRKLSELLEVSIDDLLKGYPANEAVEDYGE